MIDANRVHFLLLDCLFKDEEIIDGKPVVEQVIAEGIMHNFGFHPTRLESHRAEVRDMLAQLPDAFQKGKGGGWSFMNAPFTKDDEQWGEQPTAEELLCLGIGLGYVEWLLPRDMWSALPGGMPYAAIDLEAAP